MNPFGKNIAYLRKKRGWSQEDLAGRLNVQRTTISNYEKGVSMPPYKTLKKLADIFDMDIGRLTMIPIEGLEFEVKKTNEYEKSLHEPAILRKELGSGIPDLHIDVLKIETDENQDFLVNRVITNKKDGLQFYVDKVIEEEKARSTPNREEEIRLLELEIIRMKSTLRNLENLLERLKKSRDFSDPLPSSENESD